MYFWSLISSSGKWDTWTKFHLETKFSWHLVRVFLHFTLILLTCFVLSPSGLYLQGYRVNEQTLSVKQSVIELKPPSEEFKTFYFCAENKTENLGKSRSMYFFFVGPDKSFLSKPLYSFSNLSSTSSLNIPLSLHCP